MEQDRHMKLWGIHLDKINEEHSNKCPFVFICPKLKETLKRGIYGFCLYQPEFQAKCKIYIRLINNPSYRGRSNEI